MASSRFGCSDGFTLAGRMRDRRREARLRMTRLVQVAHDGDAAYARCRDLSDTGMKLDLTAPLELNDYVTVALSPSLVLCGKVAWIDGRECGIAFDCPVDSDALLEAAEGAARAPEMAATIELLGGRPTSAAHAASASRSRTRFQPGLAVTVMVDPNREARGVVRWAKDNIAAVEFEFDDARGEASGQALLPAPSEDSGCP
jgi:hypothetical protein